MSLLFHRVRTNVWSSAWRWVPGILAATTTLIGLEVGLFQSFQALTYNVLFRLRGSIAWDERIVVIEIDDLSIQELGQFPIARQYYVQLLNQLDEAQPSVIAFDIVFAEPSSDDETFADAIDRLNRVVLAQSWDNQGQPILPNPYLANHAVNVGHVLNPQTEDGVSRSIQPYIQDVPALGIAIAQSYSLVAEAIALPKNEHTNQAFWINWPGFTQDCQSYSFVDVLRGDVAPEHFQDKIVIVGVTASGASPPLFTPFNRSPPTGGVYLQAAVVSNLLRQNDLFQTGAILQICILILCGPFLSLLSSYRGCRRRWISWFSFCVGWNLIGLIFLRLNVLLPLFWPIVLVTLTTGLIETAERLRANRYLQREIERLWNTYNSDLVVWQRSNSQRSKPAVQEKDVALGKMMSITPSSHPIAVQRAIQLAQLADLFGRSQSLHATITQSLTVGLVAADWNGTVWLCNSFAETLLGLKNGDSLSTQLIPSWLSLDSWTRYILQLSHSTSPCWEVQRGGTWFEFKLEPLFYGRQTPDAYSNSLTSANQESTTPYPTGLLLLIQDITTFKHVESEIRNALTEALELNDLKTRFVSMASHELRTPLTIMRTSVDMLKAYGSTLSAEKQAKYLNRLEESVINMMKLIDNVLTLGRSETRRLEFNPLPLSIEMFCQDLIEKLQSGTSGKNRICFSSDLDRAHFSFDSELLSLILNNLLSNALKYSPVDSSVDLKVISSNTGVTFEICDHGIGIPTDYKGHLFEEFYRANNVGNIPGTGLGLSIVKRCVDLHGGTISLESETGVGTTFRVHFPKSVIG